MISSRDVINSVYSALSNEEKVGESRTAYISTIYCMIVVWCVHGTSVYAVLHNTHVAYAYNLLNNIRLL